MAPTWNSYAKRWVAELVGSRPPNSGSIYLADYLAEETKTEVLDEMSAGVDRMMIITYGCDCRHSYMPSEKLICYVHKVVLNSNPPTQAG